MSLLPLDVIIHILSQFYFTQGLNDDGVETLLACLRTSSLFREAACTASLWEPYYRARYKYSDSEREDRRWDMLAGNWRRLYAERRRLDKQALRLLDRMVGQRQGRYSDAQALAEFGFDIWDCLKKEIDKCNQLWEEYGGTVDCCPLTRRYWAKAIIDVIARTDAIKLWSGFILQGAGEPSFDEAMSALSCFFGQSRSDIRKLVDHLAAGCPEFLRNKGLTPAPEDQGYNLLETCKGIIEYMVAMGFGPAESSRFFELLNQFPHAYLTSNQHTIPISLVHFFVAIARRLHISASPVDFPGRVLVHIPTPEDNSIYLDVFSSAVLDRGEISAMLLQMGIPIQAVGVHLVPSGGQPMLLRVARNILSALRQDSGPTDDTVRAARQTSACIHLMLTNDTVTRLASHLVAHSNLRSLDCSTYLYNTLAPVLSPVRQAILQSTCKNIIAKEEEDRELVFRRGNAPKYFVGAVFQHVRYPYVACIARWDVKCDASDEWIRQMDVDQLVQGRNQPFYHVYAADGTAKYVAEENIRLIKLTKEIVSQLFKNNSLLSLSFEGADLNEGTHGRGRLLLSPETRFRYPDDEQIGREWVETGTLPLCVQGSSASG